MISAERPVAQTWPKFATWQESLRGSIRDVETLGQALGIDPKRLELSSQKRPAQQPNFPLFTSWEYAGRIRSQDLNDPLLRQVLPTSQEETHQPGFVSDPVGDLRSQVVPGLLHKYTGRALLITTGACAVHCRYCFRRHFPYSDAPKSTTAWQPALEYLRRDTSIEEIILSGGDPLTLPDTKLAWLVEQLDTIPHLRRLRIHTRLPIMIPSRVCQAMSDWIKSTRLSKWFVVHVNHANELDDDVSASLSRLQSWGVTLLNQSVLLAGVNDSLPALRDLSRRLLDCQVLPYYLHQLDAVQGAAHFYVSPQHGRKLLEQLTAEMSGFGVPRYVTEISGQKSKTPILQNFET